MGKARTLGVTLALVAAAVVSPHAQMFAHAQSTSTPTSCSGTFSPSPMQGRYSGTWHSDGDYHFSVWDTDLRLQIIIDGTITAVVAPGGTITGTASGTVNAPITHDGTTDVSSGHGTISGTLSGWVGPSGALVVLHAAVIDMHWGTFVGGGYTVEKFITMPDYTFSVNALDCTSSAGTISEQDFPTMAVVADGGNKMTYAPGIGPATGTWTLSADKAAQYEALSARVDSFIASANAVLDGPGSLTAGDVNRQVAAPLKSLISDIQADPDTARCLLERLASWEASAVPKLLGGVQGDLGTDTLTSLRAAGDALRAAQDIDALCSLDTSHTVSDVSAAVLSALDRSIEAKKWTDVALLGREALLLGVPIQGRAVEDINALLGSTTSNQGLLELARVAYAIGDDADAGSAYARLTVDVAKKAPHKKRKPTRKHKPAPKATPKPTARPTPRPTLTPTPVSKPTLTQVLAGGIAAMHLSVTGNTATWPAVQGASIYVVTVTGPSGLIWSWAGTETTMQLGDTALDGVPGMADDLSPVREAPGAHWTILALDGKGTIVGGEFRAKS